MKIAVTSSHRPSPLVRRFINRLASVLGGERINRGKSSIDELAAELHARGFTHLIIVDRKHGNPSRLRFYKIPGGYIGYITIHGVRRLKPRFGRVDHIKVIDSSEATRFLKEFLSEFPSSGRIGTVIEDNSGRITFRIRGKPYGVQFSWLKVVREG